MELRSMRTPLRAALRLAITGWLGLAGFAHLSAQAGAAEPPEKAHPDSTILFLKVNNALGFREAFRRSQFGQLWADPALKAFKDDLTGRLDEANTKLKEKLGVTLRELLDVLQGAASLAVVPKDDPDVPFAVLVTADAGKNAARLTDVMTKATRHSEAAGAKVAKEEFKGLTLYTIEPPKPKDEKEGEKPGPPIVWTHDASLFYIGTDADALKDLAGHSGGRDNGLAATENYAQAVKKLGPDPQAVWYLEVGKAIQMLLKAGSKGKNANNAEQFKAMSDVLGINGLRSAAGSFALNAGGYDSLTKTFVFAPVPVKGLLKLFVLPRVPLKPEAWVPANVASYQTWSWDLDETFKNLNDLANMFQPGVLNVLEQQLVGPNGGEPLNFKKDIFDPIGNRITLISDYKKPATEDSQRMLLAVALDDASVFQNTLTKLINLTGLSPKKRDFQGTTVYDFDLPEIPNANAGNVQFKGPVSLAIAKKTLFVSSPAALLEQVLRGGGPSLADSATYQSVAREIPDKVSTMSYVRPDESARVTYDMLKSGQFEKALQGAAVAGGPDVGKIGKLFDKDKLPEFSVFEKYLSQGGGFGVMEDDGMTFTSFTLRKSNP
jgi:hypothetical protein